MNEEIKHTLAVDEQTGEMRSVPVAARSGVEDGEHPMVLWEDQPRPPRARSSSVKIGPVLFHIIELTRPQLTELKGLNQAFAEAHGITVDLLSQPQALNAALAQIEDGHEKYADHQISSYEWVIARSVTDWEGEGAPEFSEEAKLKLFPSIKRRLSNEIIAKSRLGASNSDFLSA